jgi:hypothetical protein
MQLDILHLPVISHSDEEMFYTDGILNIADVEAGFLIESISIQVLW